MKGALFIPPGNSSGWRWLPATKFIGPATSCSTPNRGKQIRERQIFAERNEMHLVDRIDDFAAVVDGDDRIVVARRVAAAPRLGPHGAGDQHLAVGFSISPIAASASGRSVKRNGTAVSGHRMSCGAGRPVSAGAASKAPSSSRKCGRGRWHPTFPRWSMAGWTMRTASFVLGSCLRHVQPDIAVGHMRGDQHGRRDRAGAQIAPCGKQRRHGEDEDGQRIHAGHAGHRHALHQQRHRHRRIARSDSRESR